MKCYESWGRYPKVQHAGAQQLYWRHNFSIPANSKSVLPFGYGRSYGDCCLNENEMLLDASGLNKFISFDLDQGLLRCEAGVRLDDILDLVVPAGWFLPVTPGTKLISVGGAIANDVHGKNHHRAGTFGCHVTRLELLRSEGQRYLCSLQNNEGLFRATIGGLGLTGLITWAEIQLKPIANPFIITEAIRFKGLKDFFALSAASDAVYEYTVAWIDADAEGEALGRGIFLRGNHAPTGAELPRLRDRGTRLTIPIDMPSCLLNRWTVKCFNELYFSRHPCNKSALMHYDPFFYPLDIIEHWNRLYGRSGFLQYQCAVPHSVGEDAISELLERSSRSGKASFLSVLKAFGDKPSPGLLSFPRPGVTLAMDFRFQGKATLKLLESLDEVVRQSGGCVYPAKDARMSAESFQSFFPRWQEFAKYYVDPRFSSSFWRRVTAQ
jgi:FAD/FMN-containing dehydrogenase